MTNTNTTISFGTMEKAIGVINENLTTTWTGVSNAIATAAENLANGLSNTAQQYQNIGLQLTQEASRQSQILLQFGEGLGNPAERQMFVDVAAGMQRNIESMRIEGADAYVRYGESIVQASHQATRAALAERGGALVDIANMGIALQDALYLDDWKKFGEVSAGVGNAAAAGFQAARFAAFAALALGISGIPAAVLVFGVAGLAAFAADKFLGETVFEGWKNIGNLVSDYFLGALNWRPPRDPLVLDLDGNGITTTPINPNAPLLFDQDGDSTLTATGWIGAGEALVVRDLNASGTIDSGRELFGDSTLLTSGPRIGQKAANGFEALADLDSNADGKFDASDAAFASVKLWKDANQNAISEAGELFTFADLGVASINVAGTASNIDLGGGNTQPLSGTFNRSNGQTGNAGTAELAGSLLLANNNFYRQFTDDPQVSSAAAALPQMQMQMQGSGWVRGCMWPKRRDSGMAGRLTPAMKKGAACARLTGANGRFGWSAAKALL